MKDLLKNKKNIFIALGLAIILIIALLLIFSKGNATGNVIKEIKGCGDGTTYYNGDEGLCWQISTMPGTANNWDQANSYCENLELGNKEDWRLPTLKELEKIVDNSQKEIKIDKTYFQNTENKHYWTSTPHNTLENAHWYIHFEMGYQGYAFDFNPGYGVRCVRTSSIF